MPNDRPHTYVTMSYHRVTLRICLVLLLLTINYVINLEITSQRRSVVYMENGHDQTTIHRLTTDEKLALEHDLLKRLGLPGKPKSANGTASLMKQSALKFLLNVYENNVNKESEPKPNEILEPSEFDLTGHDLRTIDQNDVIMTFTAQQSHREAGLTPDRVTGIWFDVEAVPAAVQMTSAELRLYRSPNAKNRKNRGAFTVTAYRVLHTKDGEIEMQFVDSANTTEDHEGWITLNVTESLFHWMDHPDDNKGLYLSVRPIDRSSHEIKLEEIGIVGFEGDAERHPFMAGFFRSNGSNTAGLLQSTLGSSDDYNKRNKKRDTSGRKSGSWCNVQKFYISFKDLHWQDWVIAPAGMNANYCSGQCNHLNSETLHATLENFVNDLHPGKMPKASCVPTKLSGIDVLYYANDKTVVRRKWENGSVEACGCM